MRGQQLSTLEWFAYLPVPNGFCATFLKNRIFHSTSSQNFELLHLQRTRQNGIFNEILVSLLRNRNPFLYIAEDSVFRRLFVKWNFTSSVGY